MINYFINNAIKIVGIFFMLFLIQSCQDPKDRVAEKEKSNADIENEVRKEVEALYEAYIVSDLKWTEYYKDEYTLASQDGKIQTKYADSLKSQWADIYDKNEIIFRNHGDINIVASEDQALHYNTYDELFVVKATNDTTVNLGAWITLWKKQKDDSWKIEFETFHTK